MYELTLCEDVLQLVEALYMADVAMTLKKWSSARLSHADFYSYIYHIRAHSEKAEWEQFFQRLLSRITISCKRLQGSNSPRIYDNIPARPRRDPDRFDPPGSRPLASSPLPASSSSSPCRRSNSPLDIPKASTPSPNISPTNAAPTAGQEMNAMSQYTTILKSRVGGKQSPLDYEYESVSLTPSIFRCTVSYDGISADGMGRNKQIAKHAASKEMCSMLGLVLD